MNKKDIGSREDIIQMVDTFYTRVREDQLLGPIFTEVIQDRWPEHLEKMYRFWETILLGSHTYNGRPFPPHAKLPIGAEHFGQWLSLFRSNLEQFEGPVADEASSRAGLMASLFLHKLEHFQALDGKAIQ
ncbi:MAG: group III truncated hemoglobin [Bacteroidia bacterium]